MKSPAFILGAIQKKILFYACAMLDHIGSRQDGDTECCLYLNRLRVFGLSNIVDGYTKEYVHVHNHFSHECTIMQALLAFIFLLLVPCTDNTRCKMKVQRSQYNL